MGVSLTSTQIQTKMHSITQKLVLLFCLLIQMNIGWSQIDTTTLTINNQTACTGDTVFIPITVEDFTNVTGFQFSIGWDINQVEYLGICDLAIGTNASVISDIPIDPGAFSALWIDLNMVTTESLMDGDTLMVIKMNVLDIDANGIPIIFNFYTPAEIVIFDQDGNLQFFPPFLNNGTIFLNDTVNLMATAEPLTCADTLSSLQATANNPLTIYEWFGPDNFNSSLADTVTNQEGLYTVVGIDGNCVDTATVEVLFDTIPPMNLSVLGDTINCENTSVQIEGMSTDTGIAFSWEDPNQNILNGATQMVSEAGTYLLIAENTANGCIATDTLTVEENTTLPIAAIELNGAIDCVSDSVLLSVASTQENVVYEWQDATGAVLGTDTMFTAFDPTVFFLVATDTLNGCVTTVDTLVAEDTTPPLIAFNGTTELSCSMDSLTLEGTSFNPAVEFQWLDEQGTVLSPDSALLVTMEGSFTLEGTNPVNGCTSTETVIISSDFTTPEPSIISTENTLTCIQTNLVLEGSSNQAQSAFTWIDPNGEELTNNPDVLISETGIYEFIVTDLLNGCDSTITVEVLADTLAPDISLNTPEDLSCFVFETNLSISSTTPNAECSWLGFGDDCSISVNQAATYFASVTDPTNGCVAEDSLVVNQVSEPLTATPSVDGFIDCNNTSVNLSGGIALDNVVYTWVDEMNDTIGTGLILEVDTGGIYQLQMLDTLTNCIAEEAILVDENIAMPMAILAVNAEINCAVDSVALEATPGPNVTLVWVDEQGIELPSAFAFSAGTYFAQLMDTTSNCTALDSVEVLADLEEPLVELSFVGDSLITCTNNSVNLEAADDPLYTISWTNANGEEVSTLSNFTTENTGTYTATITNTMNSCVSSDSLIVGLSSDVPEAEIEVSNSINCEAEQATLSAISTNLNLTYEWFDEFGMSISVDSSFSTDIIGPYSLTISDTTNDCSTTLNTLVEGNTIEPDFELNGLMPLDCNVETITVSGNSMNADVVFQWLDEQGDVLVEQSTFDLSMPGMYALIGIDTVNQCQDTLTFEAMADFAAPEVSISAPNDTLTCTLEELQLEGMTNLNQTLIRWTNEAGDSLTNQLLLEVTEGGIYNLTVTNELNGCDSTATIVIETDTVAPPLTITTPMPITCQMETTILEIQSDTIGLECSWGGIVNDCSIEVSEAGMYTAMVTDPSNGCSTIDSIEVIENMVEYEVMPQVDGVIDCVNETVMLSPQGIIGNVVYTWLNTENDTIGLGPSIMVDSAGVYVLTLLDLFSGCISSGEVEVTEETDFPNTAVSVDNQIDCSNESVTLNATPEMDIEVEWQDATGNVLTEPIANIEGWYYAFFTNTMNNCTSVDSVEVFADLEEPSLVINIEGEEIITCDNPSVLLTSNSDFPENVVWTAASGGELGTGASLNTVESGTITATVSNPMNACTTSLTLTVGENTTPPAIDLMVESEFDCAEQEAVISTIENPDYQYEWTSNVPIENPDQAQLSIAEPGQYNLTVTNLINGCTASDVIEVAGASSSITNLDLSVEQPDCNSTDQFGSILVLNVPGGEAPYNFSLQGEEFGDKNTFLDLAAGDYLLGVTDANGCTYDTLISIFDANPHEVTIIADQNPVNLGDVAQLSLEFSVPENEIVEIQWFNQDSLICTGCNTLDVFLMENTTYSVLSIDANGCISNDVLELLIARNRRVFMPNVFSPNDDGFNDLLFVQGGDEIAIVHSMEIFDRWGELIYTVQNFNANDPNAAWNGKHGGQEASPGVYVYVVEVEFIDGEKVLFHGDVTLMR